MCSCTVELLATQKAKKKIPDELPFSITLDNTANFKSTSLAKQTKLIDLDIDGAFCSIVEECKSEGDESGSRRVPPLAFCRLARGGKTTFLMSMFDRLREKGYTPIIISFNGEYHIHEGETQLDALLRKIGLAFVLPPQLESERISCNQTQLMQYIEAFEASEKGRASRGTVLLIDEINQLGWPIDLSTSMFLKKL